MNRNGAIKWDLMMIFHDFSGRFIHVVCVVFLAVIDGERSRHNGQMKIDWYEGYLGLAWVETVKGQP